MARIDRQLERIAERQASLDAEVAAASQDYERLTDLGVALTELAAEREALELEWLEAADAIE